MLARLIGALALAFAIGGAPAAANAAVRCRDGSIRSTRNCYRFGGGVWHGRRYEWRHGRRPLVRCRDGSLARGPRACFYRGGPAHRL